MKKLLFFLLICFSLNAHAQTDEGLRDAGQGLKFKVILNGSGETLQPGDFAELHMLSVLKRPEGDTILNNSSDNGAPQIISMKTIESPYAELFAGLRKGDSLFTMISTDSVFKTDINQMPYFMKKGQQIFTAISVMNIYRTDAEADSARKKNWELMDKAEIERSATYLLSDDKILRQYFKEKGITNIKKTENGVYVEVLKHGDKTVIDNTDFVTINYTGKNIKGIVFDSNTDPAKGHVQPLKANLTDHPMLGNNVIAGLKEGLLQMHKGERANIYIPSPLGYGRNGAGEGIGPDEILIFEVEILSVYKEEITGITEKPIQKKSKPAIKKPVKKAVKHS